MTVAGSMTEFELLMQQSGWTVPEAAKVFGYSEGHIYRWKRGEEMPREGVMNLLRMRAEVRRPANHDTDLALLMAWMPPPDGITMCQGDVC